MQGVGCSLLWNPELQIQDRRVPGCRILDFRRRIAPDTHTCQKKKQFIMGGNDSQEWSGLERRGNTIWHSVMWYLHLYIPGFHTHVSFFSRIWGRHGKVSCLPLSTGFCFMLISMSESPFLYTLERHSEGCSQGNREPPATQRSPQSRVWSKFGISKICVSLI